MGLHLGRDALPGTQLTFLLGVSLLLLDTSHGCFLFRTKHPKGWDRLWASLARNTECPVKFELQTDKSFF